VAAPCRVLESSVGPGAQEALRRRGGSVLRAVSSGTIRVGDPVLPG
jgi:MOSC domain-containing protein YiiM